MARPVKEKRKLTLRELSEIHHVEFSLLSKWSKEGVDIYDSRQIAVQIFNSKTCVSAWRKSKDEVMRNTDEDSHEFWKKEKDKEATIALRLKNAKASGEMFDKSDGEKIQEAWASALHLGLGERRATAPQMLAGKDEGWIADWMTESDHKLESGLSDLESSLWKQTYDKYIGIDEPSSDGDASHKNTTKKAANGKRVVRRKRVSDSGADT